MPITVVGLDATLRSLGQIGRLDEALGDELHKAVPASIAGEVRGKAASFGRLPAKGLSGTHYRRLPDGAELGASGTLAAGSEFGGQRRPKQSYSTRSRKGTPYIVKRRTTMQFKPFLGQRGYALVPSWKSHLQGVRDKLGKRILKEVSGRGA